MVAKEDQNLAESRASSWLGRVVRNCAAAIAAFAAWVLITYIDIRFFRGGPVEAEFFLTLPLGLVAIGFPPFFFWLANRHEFAGHPQQLVRVLGVTFGLTAIFYAVAILPLLALHIRLGGNL